MKIYICCVVLSIISIVESKAFQPYRGQYDHMYENAYVGDRRVNFNYPNSNSEIRYVPHIGGKPIYIPPVASNQFSSPVSSFVFQRTRPMRWHSRYQTSNQIISGSSNKDLGYGSFGSSSSMNKGYEVPVSQNSQIIDALTNKNSGHETKPILKDIKQVPEEQTKYDYNGVEPLSHEKPKQVDISEDKVSNDKFYGKPALKQGYGDYTMTENSKQDEVQTDEEEKVIDDLIKEELSHKLKPGMPSIKETPQTNINYDYKKESQLDNKLKQKVYSNYYGHSYKQTVSDNGDMIEELTHKHGQKVKPALIEIKEKEESFYPRNSGPLTKGPILDGQVKIETVNYGDRFEPLTHGKLKNKPSLNEIEKDIQYGNPKIALIHEQTKRDSILNYKNTHNLKYNENKINALTHEKSSTPQLNKMEDYKLKPLSHTKTVSEEAGVEYDKVEPLTHEKQKPSLNEMEESQILYGSDRIEALTHEKTKAKTNVKYNYEMDPLSHKVKIEKDKIEEFPIDKYDSNDKGIEFGDKFDHTQYPDLKDSEETQNEDYDYEEITVLTNDKGKQKHSSSVVKEKTEVSYNEVESLSHHKPEPKPSKKIGENKYGNNDGLEALTHGKQKHKPENVNEGISKQESSVDKSGEVPYVKYVETPGSYDSNRQTPLTHVEQKPENIYNKHPVEYGIDNQMIEEMFPIEKLHTKEKIDYNFNGMESLTKDKSVQEKISETDLEAELPVSYVNNKVDSLSHKKQKDEFEFSTEYDRNYVKPIDPVDLESSKEFDIVNPSIKHTVKTDSKSQNDKIDYDYDYAEIVDSVRGSPTKNIETLNHKKESESIKYPINKEDSAETESLSKHKDQSDDLTIEPSKYENVKMPGESVYSNPYKQTASIDLLEFHSNSKISDKQKNENYEIYTDKIGVSTNDVSINRDGSENSEIAEFTKKKPSKHGTKGKPSMTKTEYEAEGKTESSKHASQTKNEPVSEINGFKVTAKKFPQYEDYDSPLIGSTKNKQSGDYDSPLIGSTINKQSGDYDSPIVSNDVVDDYEYDEPLVVEALVKKNHKRQTKRKNKGKGKNKHNVNSVSIGDKKHGNNRNDINKISNKNKYTEPETYPYFDNLGYYPGEEKVYGPKDGNVVISKETSNVGGSDLNGGIGEVSNEKDQFDDGSGMIDERSGGFEDSALARTNPWSLLSSFHGQERNKFKKCITPNNEQGNCMPIQLCPVPNLDLTLEDLIKKVCPINEVFIGICCPEFPAETLKVKWDNLTENSIDKEAMNKVESEPNDCGQLNDSEGQSSWPWMAPLISVSNRRIFCGGVLVNEQYVLTAAHCTRKVPHNQILVVLGPTSEQSFEKQEFEVIEIKRHAQYNARTMQNDIALLKLSRPVSLSGKEVKTSSQSRSICLPDEEFVPTTAILLGWQGSFAASLNEESLQVISQDECRRKAKMEVTSSIMCTEPRTEDVMCNLDSGAPLITKQNGRYEVHGILTWNRNDCDSRFPTIFTRVSHFKKWIENHLS